jgi:hypothetical protein
MRNLKRPAQSESLYDADFYAWAMANAKLLRAGKVLDADLANIAEELESMGRSEKRELNSRLTVLLAHLLKWRYQPKRRSRGWAATIVEQRLQTADLLTDSPSLRRELPENFARAYANAVKVAEKETGLDLPEQCPFTLEDALDEQFWPEK